MSQTPAALRRPQARPRPKSDPRLSLCSCACCCTSSNQYHYHRTDWLCLLQRCHLASRLCALPIWTQPLTKTLRFARPICLPQNICREYQDSLKRQRVENWEQRATSSEPVSTFVDLECSVLSVTKQLSAHLALPGQRDLLFRSRQYATPDRFHAIGPSIQT